MRKLRYRLQLHNSKCKMQETLPQGDGMVPTRHVFIFHFAFCISSYIFFTSVIIFITAWRSAGVFQS